MTRANRPAPTDAPSADEVPILAFHAVEAGPGPLCFPSERFADLVGTLEANGSVALSAGDAARRLASGQPLPPRPVVFTFDDGYASVHDRARPILEKAGYVATVFVVSGRLGGINDWDPPGSGGHGLSLMSADHVGALHAAGWEIGGHSHNHHRLTSLSETAVREEITTSHHFLETLTGAPVSSFAYPFGEFSPMVRRIASETHDACFAIGASRATRRTDLEAVERIEAWYLRTPWSVDHLHDRFGATHLAARRAARRARRWAERLSRR